MRDNNSSITPSPTLKLLRIIGSPFMSELESPQDSNEALELYQHALKDKIGLTYLEALRAQGNLNKFGLEMKYEEEQHKYNTLRLTASRVCHQLNSHGIKYAVFKSIMPFPAVTNDTDILHLGSTDEYHKAVVVLTQAGFTVHNEEEPVPLQVEFHDARDGPHLIIGGKDPYDFDLYKEASTSHIIYLDRRKLVKYVTDMNVLGEQIKVLKPEAELIAMITHALFPELLYTLLVYYATLYCLRELGSKGISEFIHVARVNNVTYQVKTHCSLTAVLHQEAHGFVPNELKEVLRELGNNPHEVKFLQRNQLKTPYRYSWGAVIRAFLEKVKERKFLMSIIKQTAATISNPKLARRVWRNLIWRKSRETY